MPINFRNRIKKLLQDKDLSVYKLAKISEINSASLYRSLRGESSVSADKVEKMLNALREVQDRKDKKMY